MNSFPLPTSTEFSEHRESTKLASPFQRRSSRSRYCLTYAEWITRALLSSNDKSMCLADIYEWMAFNVPGLKEQRFLHSSKGWKNAVRHTLSINPRFNKQKRFGKPALWTLSEEYLRQTESLSKMTNTPLLNEPLSASPSLFAESHGNDDSKDGSGSRIENHRLISPNDHSESKELLSSHTEDWTKLTDAYANSGAGHSSLSVQSQELPRQSYSTNDQQRRQQDYQRLLAALAGIPLLTANQQSPIGTFASPLAPPSAKMQMLQVTALNGSDATFLLPRPLPIGCLTDQKLFLASLIWPNFSMTAYH